MPKLVYLLYRNDGVDPGEFVRHYDQVHSPLAVEAMPAQTYYAANLVEGPKGGEGREVASLPTPAAVAFLRFDDAGILNDPAKLYRSKELEDRLAADFAHLFSGMHGYVVDEVVQWTAPRTWPLGQPSPGLTQVSLVRKLPGLDAAEFRHRYEHGHGAIARVHHPGIWRYIQNFVIEPITPGAPALDAVTELHFQSEDDFRDRYYRDSESPRIVAEDVARFLDRSETLSVLAHERIWID